MSINPAPRPLSINIHRNGKKTDPNSQASNCKEDVSNPLGCDPIVQIVCQAKSKHILDEVHRGECLSGLISVAIDNVGYYASCSELDTEVDQSESDDDRYLPRILSIRCLPPCEKASGSKEEVGHHYRETEFGFFEIC